MKAQTSKPTIIVGNADDTEYAQLLTGIRLRFEHVTDHGANPVFTTDAADLWGTFLRSFRSLTERQHRNCHTCRRFIEKYGILVVIDEDGSTIPVLWQDYRGRDIDRKAHNAMAQAVLSAKVTGVFLSSEKEWGTGVTGPWRHLAVTPVGNLRRKKSPVASDSQAMAEKVQDYETVSRAIHDFSIETLEQAVSLLQTDALYRSEKILGQAEWLLRLRRNVDVRRLDSRRNNIIWSAVASAPSGFCHPRSSMIGTLLEDLAAGLPFGDVSRRFASKMHPLQYQRPQAPPKAGAIAAAEKIVDQLKAAGSLNRRFASLSEVQATWVPMRPFVHVRPRGGVFDHLYQPPASVGVMKLPTQTLTWEKFERTMLPNANRIEFLPPERGSYSSLVTAVDMNAPPIIQWDHDDNRNPVSWYFWNGGSSASQFRLDHRTFCDVVAICHKPCFWNGVPHNVPDGVMLILKDALDTGTPGSCLFPEILKSEFHGVRSVIEAHSNVTPLQRLASGQYAAGYMLGQKEKWNITIRVHMKNQIADVKLDRWD